MAIMATTTTRGAASFLGIVFFVSLVRAMGTCTTVEPWVRLRQLRACRGPFVALLRVKGVVDDITIVGTTLEGPYFFFYVGDDAVTTTPTTMGPVWALRSDYACPVGTPVGSLWCSPTWGKLETY